MISSVCACGIEDNALDEGFFDCYLDLDTGSGRYSEPTPKQLAAEDERHEREEAKAEGRRYKSKRRPLRR